jgi:glycosyltransferase involved in cell wall biosynthesis
MSAADIELTVVMPALNEEKSVSKAISECVEALDEYGIAGEIIVVNDGSTDGTGRIAAEWSKRDPRVSVIVHDRPRGIGGSFWDGVDKARGAAVVMLPGDNENDPREIFQYQGILDHVDIVIPFVYNKTVRSLYRNTVSFLYRFIVNTTFLVYFNYTNGTNLYRTSILRELDQRSTSFFFQTDMLVRLVKKGYLFAEVPYRLRTRKSGVSRSATFPSFVQVVRGYIHLVKDIYWGESGMTWSAHTSDSVTRVRRRAAKRSS